MRVLVTGAGGFIGGHLVKRLLDEGHDVLATDLKAWREWDQVHDHEHLDNWDLMDLRNPWECEDLCVGQEWVFNLAADMGGMGFIESHKAECMLSVLISTNMLVAARDAHVKRFFYSSSACVYPQRLQNDQIWLDLNRDQMGLAEDEAYPADPEDGYGWEKLFSERMCRHFSEDFGLETRVARYHNVYGPYGTWTGGREKAPAAICRKVAEAKLDGSGMITIWGDGGQLRSFTYIDDAVDGTLRLMASDVTEPLNIGSDQMVSILDLVHMAARMADLSPLMVWYDKTGPQGVRGRNSDNTLIREKLGWAPSVRLEDGLIPTYHWIAEQVLASQSVTPVT